MARSKDKDGGIPSVLAGKASLVPDWSEAWAPYETVFALMVPVWKEGKCVRLSGRVGIRVVGPYFVATLTCPSEGLETSVTLADLCNLMVDLESHCRSPQAIWTPTFDRVKAAKADEQKARKGQGSA